MFLLMVNLNLVIKPYLALFEFPCKSGEIEVDVFHPCEIFVVISIPIVSACIFEVCVVMHTEPFKLQRCGLTRLQYTLNMVVTKVPSKLLV
jgi:hypothetical protein